MVGAAANTNINFQARILTNTGALVSDGFYSVQYNIYAQSSGGASQWSETQVTTSKNGYITASLGSVNPFGTNIDWSQEQWLSININGDGEMSPRMKITAVPYAFKAAQAQNVASNSTNAPSSNSDNISIQTGNATGATSNSGNVNIDSGTATGTAGTISIGAANASGITIGRIGLQTNIAGNALIAGGSAVIGTASQAGSLILNDGIGGQTTTLQAGNSAGNLTFTLPTTVGAALECLQNSGTPGVLQFGACGAGGGTLQSAYDNSVGGIVTVTATDGAFRVRDNATTFGNNAVFAVQNNGATVDYFAVQGDGDVAVDANTLFVDALNNRVGIGTGAPTAVLNVTNAAPASVAGATGTAQIAVANFAGGTGGATTIATTGTGGAGGAFTVSGGAGGQAASALTSSAGGAGGALNLNGGIGGAAAVAGTGNNSGGAGGAFNWLAGTGGAATGATSGNNTGGAGGAISLQAGTGGAANTGTGNLVGGNGGTLTLSGGTGGIGSTSGGNGGAVTLQGGTAAAMAGAAGGSATVSGRAGSATGSGGNGGALTLQAGSAGGDNTVNRTGGGVTITAGASRGASAGGTISLTAGTGGNNLAVGTATGGASGGITFNAGNGGIAPNATTFSTGGAAGGITVSGGIGGAASVAGTGNNTGGSGGANVWTGGTGGIANGATTGINTGGTGGSFTLQAGSGGAANTGTGSNVGGTGGALTFSGGTGGVGTTSGGNGGAVTIQGGAAAAMAGAAGGAVSITGTQGSNTGSGGAGGALTLSGGNARGDNTVSRAGGSLSITAGSSIGGANGGALTLSAGSGGTNLTVGTATGGSAGGITFNGGNGASASNATVSSTGGSAGGFTINGGTGGNASVAGTGSNTGGNGGAFTWTAGNGGAANGATSGINTGGTGGTVTLRAGNGGAATTGSGTLQGGAGGGLVLQAGTGGIGTVSGIGGAVTLRGGTSNTAGGDIIVETATTATLTERMRVTNTGYVGIGTGTTTSLPNARLTVVAENVTGSQIKLRSQRAAVVATNVIGGIDFDSNDSSLTAPGVTTARIQAVATASHTTTVNDTALVFSTSSGATLTERWRISASGEFQGNGASILRANAGNLTLGTVTSGNVIIDGAGTLEVQDNININSGQLTVTSSTVNGVSALGNFAVNGAIGTAITTVDIRTGFTINQTTAGRTLTLPTPTANTVAGRIVYISNIGTTSFTMHGVTIAAGASQSYIYNGSVWAPTNVGGAGAGVNAVGLLDSQTKSSDGAVISGTTLYLQTADATNPGLVSTGTQSFAGDKTFTGVASFTGPGTGILVSNNAGITGNLSVGGTTTLSGNLIASGSSTATTGTTTGTGTNTTTLTLTADAFNVNDVIYIDNAGQDYYTRVTVDPGTGSYTISPAVTFENSRTVTKYTVQNMGATTSDYTNLNNRFFQGYFLGGVVIGAGSTTISDGVINSTTTLRLQENGGSLSIGGALNVTGTITGDASGLTNIDASQIASGAISDSNLSTNVTLLGNTFNGANQLVQLNASSELPGLSGVNLTNLNADNIASGTLNDSRLSSNVTLLGNTFNGINQLVRLDGAGKIGDSLLSSNITAAGNTFNGNSQLVQLTGTGALPALNGSGLTSLNGSNISSGTVADARLSTNVTLLGNTFNGANQLVQLNASSELPGLSGVNLTNLNADNIASGTLNDSRLSSNVTLLGNTFNGINQLVRLDGAGILPTLSGTNLTGLSAGNISNGTLDDSRLSSNVGLTNSSQTYSAQQTFAANILLGTDTSTPTAGTLTLNDGVASNGFTTVLGTSSLTANRSVNLPNESGTLCISTSASCGFTLLAPGSAQADSTTNNMLYLNKTGASGDILNLQKNGTSILRMLNNGALQLTLTDAAAFTVENAGGTDFFNVDTSAGLVRIGGAAADATGVLLVLDSKNTAGDPAGTNGGMYYNSSSNAMRCYENGQWKNCVDETTVVKTADQTVTNNAAFQNDSNLSFAMAANSTYTLDATINYSGTSTAADFKYTFTAPAGSTVYINADAANGTTSTTICNIAASGQTCSVLITGGFRGIININGYVRTGATAGNLQFQFAQNTGTAGQSVTVYQGSMLAYRKTQ